MNKKTKIETSQEELPTEQIAVAFDKDSLSPEKITTGSFTKTNLTWERMMPAMQLAAGTMQKIKGVIVTKEGVDLIF